MAELLPQDLMFEILVRLPIKSLLRFRCVSRGCRDQIDSGEFMESHFNYNLSKKPPSLLILHRDHAYNTYDVVDSNSIITGGPAFRELPCRADGQSLRFVGQCNGLVCISDCRAAFLWNPATRKVFVFELPPPRLRLRWLRDLGFGFGDSDDFWFRNWGFGYDKDSDDYKVVVVRDDEEAEEAESCYFVWIYSLRSRSWKRIDDFPYSLNRVQEEGVFVNGALHWKVCRGESVVPMIGALHLGKLEYHLVPLPDYNIVKDFMDLGELHGRLCAVYDNRIGDDFDLWIMKEYGVMESWTKLIRLDSYNRGFMSLAYLRNDEVLLFTPYSDEGSDFELETTSLGRGHEIETRSFEDEGSEFIEFERISLGRGYDSYVYVPSLVCPQNGC